MAILKFTNDLGEEESIHIGKDQTEIIIGRKKECHLRTQNNTVSRMHAKIIWSNGKYILQDLESANGTYYKRRRLKKNENVTLEDGETIFCGNFPVEFRLDESDLVPATPPSPPPQARLTTPPSVTQPPRSVTPPPGSLGQIVQARGTSTYSSGAQATKMLEPEVEGELLDEEAIVVCSPGVAKPTPPPPPKLERHFEAPGSDVVSIRQDREVEAKRILQEEKEREKREAELRARIEHLTNDISNRDDIIRKLQLQVEELSRAVKKYEQEYAADEEANLKIREMELVVQSSQREIEDLEAKLESANQELLETRRKLEDANSRNDKLLRELDAIKAEKEELKNQVNILEGHVEELRNRPTISPETQTKLEKALQDLELERQAKATLEKENQEIEGELNQAQEEISRMSAEIERLRGDVERFKAELTTRRNEQEKLKGEKERYEAQIAKMMNDVASSQQEVASLKESIAKLAEERDIAIKERDSARQALEIEKANIGKETDELKRKITELETQLAESKTLGSKAEELANELKSVNDELAELRVANRGYLKRIARLIEENEKLRSSQGGGGDPEKIKALETENATLRAELERTKGELSATKSKAEMLASRVGTLEAQLSALSKEAQSPMAAETIRNAIDNINELASSGRTSLEVISGLLPEVANLLPPGPEQQELVEQIRTNAAILAQTVRDIKTLVLQVRKVL